MALVTGPLNRGITFSVVSPVHVDSDLLAIGSSPSAIVVRHTSSIDKVHACGFPSLIDGHQFVDHLGKLLSIESVRSFYKGGFLRAHDNFANVPTRAETRRSHNSRFY